MLFEGSWCHLKMAYYFIIKGFNRVCAVSIFEDMLKPTLQSIVNYEVILNKKETTLLKFGESGDGWKHKSFSFPSSRNFKTNFFHCDVILFYLKLWIS